MSKKFIIGSSIALLVIFGATLGITYGVTMSSLNDPNEIYMNVGGERVNIWDLQGMEKDDWNKSITTFDETTDEGTESSSSTKAEVLETEFYSLALFGTTDYSNFNNIGYYGGLLIDQDDDINSPYRIKELLPDNFDSLSEEEKEKAEQSVAKNYKSAFIEIKLFKETFDKSVFSYLRDIDSDNPEITKILVEMEETPESEFNGVNYLDAKYNDVKTNEDIYSQIVDVLTTDVPYQKETFKEMYIYSYLWQDSNSRMYDYNFTEALVDARPSIVSSMTFDFQIANDAGLPSKYEDGSDIVMNASDWNTLLNELDTANALSADTEIDNGIDPERTFNGFSGIQFGTTDNSAIETDFYDSSRTWNLGTDVANSSKTTTGEFSNEDILTTANLYLATQNYAEGKGALINDGGIESTYGVLTGDVSMVAYNQLYPYEFATYVSEGSDEYLTNPKFSLFANVDGTTFTEATIDENDEYIFDRWFGEDFSNIGEIYISEEIIGHDSTLNTKALNYWNDKGYYIELSGSASDDYLSLLPSELLKKD